MLIRPPRTRARSRFRSGRLRTERERKEYLVSLYSAAAVKLGLGIALLIAGAQAFRAAQVHAPGVSLALRLFMPLAFAAGALFALRSGVRGLREARETRDTPLLGTDDDGD